VNIFFIALISLAVYRALPIRTVLKYAVGFNGFAADKQITIKSTLNQAPDPLTSIAKVLLKNYVTQIEKYKYSDLKDQITFVNANSSRYVFNQYYNFIGIDNKLSPVIRFQDQAVRSIKVLSVDVSPDLVATIKFRSTAKDFNNAVIENMLWQANVFFKIDPIVMGLANGTKFNFLVTDYKVKLLKNEGAY
jgi:type IV secretory pathway component VirB8